MRPSSSGQDLVNVLPERSRQVHRPTKGSHDLIRASREPGRQQVSSLSSASPPEEQSIQASDARPQIDRTSVAVAYQGDPDARRCCAQKRTAKIRLAKRFTEPLHGYRGPPGWLEGKLSR